MNPFLERCRAGLPLKGVDIVDVHGHIGPWGFTIGDLSISVLVRGMDRMGIGTLITSHHRCMRWDPDEMETGNDAVYGAMRDYPGRILGYMSISPLAGAALVRRAAERRVRQGFTGVKLHNGNGFPYDDPGYTPLYEVVNAHRMPVLLHTWGGAEEFKQIRKLAARFPEITFILAHGGSANPTEYCRLVRECARVVMDSSFSRSPRGLLEQLVAEGGVENVVWGSDVYFMSQAQQLGKVIGARLSEAEMRMILGLNAREILARIQR